MNLCYYAGGSEFLPPNDWDLVEKYENTPGMVYRFWLAGVGLYFSGSGGVTPP